MNSQQIINTPQPITSEDTATENCRVSKDHIAENCESDYDDPAESSSPKCNESSKRSMRQPLRTADETARYIRDSAAADRVETRPEYNSLHKSSFRASSIGVSNRTTLKQSIVTKSVKLATKQLQPIGQADRSHHIIWRLMSGTTVGQAIASATKRLRSVESLTAQLDAQVILARLLGRDRSWIFAHHDEVLTDDELERYSELVARRTNHEPVAYLVGCKEFYGLEFMVDERVLIPRPETELLVDAVLDHIEMRAHDLSPGERLRVADIGTGSGAIAIAVAVNSPKVNVYATDVSPDALEIARLNIKGLDKRCQVSLLEGNLLMPLIHKIDLPRVNVIVANLPYITTEDYPKLQRDVRDYEPVVALAAGPEGLDKIQRLLEQAPACIEPDGLILLEIGADQGAAVVELAQELIPQANSIILRQDHNGRDRLVMIAM